MAVGTAAILENKMGYNRNEGVPQHSYLPFENGREMYVNSIVTDEASIC